MSNNWIKHIIMSLFILSYNTYQLNITNLRIVNESNLVRTAIQNIDYTNYETYYANNGDKILITIHITGQIQRSNNQLVGYSIQVNINPTGYYIVSHSEQISGNNLIVTYTLSSSINNIIRSIQF